MMPKSMSLLAALLAGILPSICTSAETSKTPHDILTKQQHALSQKSIRGQPRRAEEDDESYLPENEDEEWYLPVVAADDLNGYDPDLKVNLKRTWLFGAGDPTDWGGVVSDMGNATNSSGSTILPIEIPSLRVGEHVTAVSAGGLHSAVLTNEGRIFTSGGGGALAGRGLGRSTNNGNELGFAPISEVYPLDPAANNWHSSIPTTILPRFVKVAASQYYTFALDNLGNVWATGNNAYGQLGMNDTITRDRLHQVMIPIPNDENVFDVQGMKIIDIVLGERHTLMLREDGKLWGCGWNPYGQLGIGLKGGSVLSPVEIIIDAPDQGNNGTVDASNEFITSVVAGRGSSYFLTKSGNVYASGTNFKGQLCLGHREDRTLPTMITGVESFLANFGRDLQQHALSQKSIRGQHRRAEEDNESYLPKNGDEEWYLPDVAEDPNGYDPDLKVNLKEGIGISSIAAGVSSLYILLSNGLVLACGENTQGQLGIGSDVADIIDVPTSVANVSDATAVMSGPMSFGAFLVSDRSIYEVGFDGMGARENWNVPNMMACVNEETTITKGVVISSGNDHTLYLATVETTFECETGPSPSVPSNSPSLPPKPKINPPSRTRPPTPPPTTIFPTTTAAPSSAPSSMPSGTPSVSLAPSVSSAPTYETDSPVQIVKTTRETDNGACGQTFSTLSLLGASVALIWQLLI